LLKACEHTVWIVANPDALLQYFVLFGAVFVLLQEFFLTVKDIVRRSLSSGSDPFAKWTDVEKQLNKE